MVSDHEVHTMKTSRNNLSNKIENYKEVRQALRGTPWEIP